MVSPVGMTESNVVEIFTTGCAEGLNEISAEGGAAEGLEVGDREGSPVGAETGSFDGVVVRDEDVCVSVGLLAGFIDGVVVG